MPRRSPYTPAEANELHRQAVEERGKVVPAGQPITLYTGAKGEGKSVSAIVHVAEPYVAGVPLFHNGSAHIGEQLDLTRFRDNGYQDCIILIDELEEYLNNLRTGATVQLDTIGVLIQMRHQGVEVVATTQYPSEINGRFLRRVDNHVICRTKTKGRSVFHTVISSAWDQDSETYRRVKKRVLRNAGRFHNLYDHRRYVQVGGARLNASELRAQAQLAERNSVWSYVVTCALKGTDSIKAATVQFFLSTLEPPVNSTVQKIGMALRDFSLYGFTLESKGRHGQSREWIIPAGLADAYAIDQPDEAARIREE